MTQHVTKETIKATRDKAHNGAKANGWWEDIPEDAQERAAWVSTKIDLIAGEGSEAVEAMRVNKWANKGAYTVKGEEATPEDFETHIKDTVEDEVADIVTRALDIMGHYGIDPAGFHLHISEEGTHPSTIDLLRQIRLEALSLAAAGTDQATWPLEHIIGLCWEIADQEGIDLQWHIDAKLAYNATRGIKHGKEF